MEAFVRDTTTDPRFDYFLWNYCITAKVILLIEIFNSFSA